ncbi:MAG: response regulator [Anaerolineae bacterium]
MDIFELFEEHLQETLTRLNDPRGAPSEIMCRILACDPHDRESVREALLAGIESLKPGEGVPDDTPAARFYQVLVMRYAQNLTQEVAAERLGITPRHLRREQRQAVSVLARYLWQRAQATQEVVPPQGAPTQALEGPQDWRSQVRAEVASLQACAPTHEAVVGDAIAYVVGLAERLASARRVALVVGHVESDMIVTMRPEALRQVTMSVIARLLRSEPTKYVMVSAGRRGDRVEIVMAASSAADLAGADNYLAERLLDEIGGWLDMRPSKDSTEAIISLPGAGSMKVLVVDDNLNLVHFYKRYVAGTRYTIEHLPGGEGLFERVAALQPAVIVLDVMLPGVDGWELLAYLHSHEATRALPIVVCSVVREEELALALGATLYVAKPVGRQAFIQALDRALMQAASRPPSRRASNSTTG